MDIYRVYANFIFGYILSFNLAYCGGIEQNDGAHAEARAAVP